MKKIIGICCPVFNEEDNIENFYNTYSKIFLNHGTNYKIVLDHLDH